MKNITRSFSQRVVKFLTACLAFCLSVFLCVGAAIAPIRTSADSGEQINHFGTVVPCGKDNGYKPNTTSGWNPWTLLTVPGAVMGLIPDDDPHKGWSLGSFFVEGFSSRTQSNLNAYGQEMPVYLKNVGDEVTFGFKLEQDINKLNGDGQLKIADDHKVIQDCWVEDPYVEGDFNHGVLIIVHTDYQGVQKISTYRDFLRGKTVGANTQVTLFEEGDYRVILCYEIYKDTSWNWITDWMDPNGSWFAYRIESYFSVRNGNCMVYPFELDTGSELTNKSYTEKGFRVDLANSRYLQLSAKKENLNAVGTDIVEDTRFNKAIADNTQFSAEGKYTIRVHNPYTNLTTEKIIYVGTNEVMRCNAVTGLSVSEIRSYVRKGYKIREDGTLYVPQSNKTQTDEIALSQGEEKGNELSGGGEGNGWKTAAIVSMAIIGVGIVVVIIKKIFSY